MTFVIYQDDEYVEISFGPLFAVAYHYSRCVSVSMWYASITDYDQPDAPRIVKAFATDAGRAAAVAHCKLLMRQRYGLAPSGAA